MRAIILLLLLQLSFAAPPIAQAMERNDGADLEGYYNGSLADDSSLQIAFGSYVHDLTVSLFVDIAGMNVMVDNMTAPLEGLSLITARGYEMEHVLSRPSEGYPDFICDLDWFTGGAQYAWRCDFEDDYCAEYENGTSMGYDANVTFTFRDATETVGYSSNVVPVPEAVLEAMRNSTGAEDLRVSIEGNATFLYVINDRSYDGLDCYSVYYNYSASVPFSVNASFPVAGESKLLFMSAPILREQWFRNNRFDMVVLSQAPLYHAQVLMDGDISRDIALRGFYNETDGYGLMRIYSNLSEADSWIEYRNLTYPRQLQAQDHGYAFIYRFNHSYQGIGRHALALEVEDSFLDNASYHDVLISRALTYNGTSREDGGPIGDDARPSAAFRKQELTLLEMGLGFVALILFLSFLNVWVPR